MAQQETRRSLPDRVAGLYYAHGLFCSSHPFAVISIAITIVLLCCYPLLNLPLPGDEPQRLWSSGNSSYPGQWNTSSSNQDSQLPRWFVGSPTVYIQQIVLKTTVAPWTNDLLLTDAFRAPLAQVFQLLEIIRNFQYENSSKTISNLCLHVESVKVKADKRQPILPEYNCLLLSPAGLWQNNRDKFQEDSNILTTIYGYQNLQKGKISLAEMLFGMSMKETGIKRYPLRTRQRVVQYAVTLILEENDSAFLQSLREKLVTFYPLHQQLNETYEANAVTPSLHIYYPGKFHFKEFLPLAITYFCLFLYVYFSVRKIELVKSKIGMAFSAMAAVLASLSMSIGLCFFFGLTLNLNGKEIYPYLVVIVGLENVLVLTKSVVSTPMHLDVKIRVAQGLSREGWSITKNLLTEVTILTIGLFTFVPAIQEFCIFAVVGLLSDFFLQMLFFSTVLAIDIRRMEQTSDYVRINPNQSGDSAARRFRQPYSQPSRSIVRSKSHPKLNGMTSAYPTNVIASYNNTSSSLVKLPKRLRLVHFWARTRIFQRMFMVSMVVWISVISYNSFPVDQLFPATHDSDLPNIMLGDFDKLPIDEESKMSPLNDIETMTATSASILPPKIEVVSNEDMGYLRHVTWQLLSNYHWPAILSMYNISLSGRYISILPAVRLSHLVSPDQAKTMRNVREKQARHFQWQALAAALDPLDFSEDGQSVKSGSLPSSNHLSEAPFVPTSPMELLLTALLCVVSVIVLAYTMVVLYGCVCTRNYAEWRSSWVDKENTQESASQVVMEAMPLVLDGHQQDIECLATDGTFLVSSDLSGQLRVWDTLAGETLAVIDRKTYFASQQKSVAEVDQEDLPLSDYESGSPPSSSDTIPTGRLESAHLHDQDLYWGVEESDPLHRNQPSQHFWNLPDLSPTINTNFTSCAARRKLANGKVSSATNLDSDLVNNSNKSGYDYGDKFRRIYYENQKYLESECNGLDNDNSRTNSSSGNNCSNSDVVNRLRTEEPNNAEDLIYYSNSVAKQSGFNTHETQVPNIRNNSLPTSMFGTSPLNSRFSNASAGSSTRAPSVWCLDYNENLIAIGCSNGRLEFWEGSTGIFKCLFEDGSGIGVTSIRLIGNRVVAAKLSGCLDFYELESYSHGRPMDWGFTSHRRTHVRSGSAGSALDWDAMVSRKGPAEDIRCIRLNTSKAHQQPITVLDSEGGRVLTGSQDHTLKVYRLEDQLPLYTLHGHCGPITCLFIDRISPMMSGSGSQDGLLCVWDLLTGACMYSIQAHNGSVSALTYSASYVISLGTDDRLCVWERFQGHLLNTISVIHTYCTSIVMLTHNLLITSKQGSLVVWDVRSGDPVRLVTLGHSDSCVFVKQMLLLSDSIACDYGNQLRVVRFPLVTDKCD